MRIEIDKLLIKQCLECHMHYQFIHAKSDCPFCYMTLHKREQHLAGRACDNQHCHKVLKGNSDAKCFGSETNSVGESLIRNTDICKGCIYNDYTVGRLCSE